jgi:hypothetical protein
MALNTTVGTNPVTLVLSLPAFNLGTTVSWAFNRRIRNFTTDQRLAAMAASNTTLYGVNHPGRLATTRVFRFKGDGSTVAFTLPTAATGVTYPTTADASITAANILATIALVLPEERGMEVGATMLVRRGSDATPGATEFKINGTTVTVGTAPAVGKWLEIIIPETITQITGGTLAAGVKYVIKAMDFFSNGAAICNIEAIQR